MIILSTIIFSVIFLFSHNYFVINKIHPNNRFIFIIFMQITSGLTLLSFIFIEPLLTNYYLRKFSLLISQQTYSIYLFHMILIYILKKMNYSILLTSAVYIILLFLISTLVYKFFEKPIMELRPKII